VTAVGDLQVRRPPVLDAGDEIVAIVAAADLATRQSGHTDETLRELPTPGC
jgi:CBS-domain-containing membrane protein